MHKFLTGFVKDKSSILIRAAIVLISIILQILTMLLLIAILHDYASWAYLLLEIISIAVVFVLVNDSSSFNSFWIVIITALPVFGYCLYFMWGRQHKNRKFIFELYAAGPIERTSVDKLGSITLKREKLFEFSLLGK